MLSRYADGALGTDISPYAWNGDAEVVHQVEIRMIATEIGGGYT
jgi:hypothetical protein